MIDAEFVEQIDGLGFFKYVDPSRLESAKDEIRNNGWTGVFGENGRLFNADAENLAEGGVGEFLSEIDAFLKRQGVSVSQVEERFAEDEYSIVVNGEEYLIWNADELSRSEKELGLLWGMSTVRTFALVDALLAQVGSSEKLFAVNGGNDLFGFFLTKELKEALCGHPEATPESRPYLPEAVYPWFGQEHE